MLDFRPLRVSDKESCPHIIHRADPAPHACRGTATRAYSAVGNMILKGMDPREWLLRWNGQNIVAFR